MGFLDSVIGNLGGQEQGSVMSVVTGLITNSGGAGLGGLMRKFKTGGLGPRADSWVGKGPNLPISAEQIQSVLGSDMVRQMAAKAGISPDELSGQLANLLPQVIDKVTPEGNVPSESSVQQGLGGLLQGFLGGR